MKPKLIKNFISTDLAETFAALFFLSDDIPEYLFKQEGHYHAKRIDNALGVTWNHHSPLWGDALMIALESKLRDATGLNLTPTYSFVRLYEHESELPPHYDKAHCEFSISVCLAHRLNEPNLLVIEDREENSLNEFDLAPGDGLLFDGMNSRHWRDPVNGWLLMLYLHFVDTNGDYRDLAYDHRPGTGALFRKVQGRLSLGGDVSSG